MNQSSLYNSSDIYGRVFPLDEEELGFWRELAAQSRAAAGIVVDLGAGSSNLGALLAGPDSTVALDVSRPLLTASPLPWRVLADAAALPLRGACAKVVLSRLFAMAYAAAGDPGRRLPALASEVGRVLAPGAVAALEIPLCARPRRMQGIEESAQIAPELEYRFRYFEVTAEHELGAVLESQITVEGPQGRWELETPLFVFTPEGARRWAARAGLDEVRFFAAYDLETETTEPPADALRGVLFGRRGC